MYCSTECDLFKRDRHDKSALEGILKVRFGGGTYGNPCRQITKFCVDNNVFPDDIDGTEVRLGNTNVYSVMGVGTYGMVLGVCTGRKKKFAIKIVSTDFGPLDNEVEMQDLFYMLGLAPRVYGLKTWGSHSFISMDQIETTLYKYLVDNRESNAIDIHKIFGDVEGAVKTMYDHNIYHGDMHLDNIAVKLDSDGDYDGIMFIDFGFSEARIGSCTHITLELQFFVEYLQILRTIDDGLGPLESRVRSIIMRKLRSPELRYVYNRFITGDDLEFNRRTQDDTLLLAHAVLAHSDHPCTS